MQPFEVIANLLALVVLGVLAGIHIYGRHRFEPEKDTSQHDRRD
jgi:hypothetical protein